MMSRRGTSIDCNPGYNCKVLEEQAMPSLVDDPSFLADLDALDNGLIGTATVSRVVPSVAAAPIVLQPGSRRPLLDLFPLNPRVARMPAPFEGATVAASEPVRTLRFAAPVDREAAPQPRYDESAFGSEEPAFRREQDVRSRPAPKLEDIDTANGSDWLRFVGAGVLFVLLASVGASAAALVFHERVQAIVARWHSPQP